MDKFLYRLSRKGEIPWLTIARGKTVGAVTVLIYDPDGKILMARGTSVPSGTAGYAKGAMFFKTDAGNGVQALYENIGTTSSCSFSLVGSIVPAEIAMTEGNILVGNNTGVGVLLSAKTNGAVLIGNGTTIVSAVVSGDASIASSGVLTIANNAVTNAKLADMAAGTVKVGSTGNVPTDLALSANDLLTLDAGIPAVVNVGRKQLVTGGATALTVVSLAAGEILSADGTDLVPIAIAAGEVMVGATGPAIDGVALSTGTILKGVTGATPVTQSIAAKQLLIYGSGAGDITVLNVAAGDIVTANASDIAVVSIAAGEVVVGATGPVIDGVALGDGALLIGNSGATPSALTLAANEVLYKPAAGTLAGLAVGRKTLLTGGATQLQAVSIAAGSIVTVDADDIIGLSIPAKSIPYTDSGTGLLAALSVAEGSIIIGGASDVTTLDGKGDGKILIGNGTTMTSRSVSGVITLTNAGVTAFSAGAIVDADVNASAAIAGSKISPLFHNTVGLYGSEQTVTTAGDAQYSPANLLGLVVLRDPNGGNRTDTLPDADDLVAAITGAYVGMAFYITIHNNADAAETIQIAAGVNCDLHPAAPSTIAQNKSQTFLIILENVGTGTEAYAAYEVTNS
jgi:hypothetical protein